MGKPTPQRHRGRIDCLLPRELGTAQGAQSVPPPQQLHGDLLPILHKNISLSVLRVSNESRLTGRVGGKMALQCKLPEAHAWCAVVTMQRHGREASLYSVVVQAIFLEAVPHGTKVDAKQFGRFLLDSLRSIQGFQEQGSFNLFNHLLKVNPIRRNVEIDGTPLGLNLFVQVGTEMLGGQLVSVSRGPPPVQ